MEANTTTTASGGAWNIGRGRQPHYDAIRLILAALVLFGHSWQYLYRLPGDDPREWMMRLTCNQASSGYIAVDGFFLLSGALLAASWRRSPSLLPWLGRRAARIYPGFAVMTLVMWLFVGYFLNEGPWDSYTAYLASLPGRVVPVFGDPLGQTLFLLRVVVPQTIAVNYPSWTLQFEGLAYFLLAAVGAVGLLRSERLARGTTLVLFLAAYGAMVVNALHDTGPNTGLWDARWWWVVPVPWTGIPSRLLACFFCGSAFALWQDRIPRSQWLLLTALVALIGAAGLGHFDLVLPVAGAYCLFWAGSARTGPLARWSGRLRGDISYGVYLYGCPIQMLLGLYLGPDRLNPYTMFALALSGALLCGLASWRFVESPFLRRRKEPVVSASTTAEPTDPERLPPPAVA